ncbi:MAG: hypothetical protein ACRC6M_00835 [Microcystaceae cyanobacterium]
MGQAKRRAKLDPYFGENKTILQKLIESDELFDKPVNVYLGAFVLMQLKPIVIIDAINYNKITVNGVDSEEHFPKYLENYKKEIFSRDFSKESVMILSAEIEFTLIMGITKDKVDKSIKWAEYKGLEIKTSDSIPKRIANFDLMGVN